MPTKATCNNCGAALAGKYCHACGEKKVEGRDFTLTAVLAQVLDALTNVDAKLWKTLQLLFFFPGKLSSQYVAGVRVPYMRPFQLFLVANVLFFIFMTDIDIFRTPSKWFFVEDFDGIKVLEKVNAIAAAKAMTLESIAHRYDTVSSDFAKGFIILLIPFIALVNILLNRRRKYEVGKHFIFATHYFTFILLLAVILGLTVPLLAPSVNRWYFVGPMMLSMWAYYSAATRHFYQYRWPGALLRGTAGFWLVLFGITLYRHLISWLALYSI